MTRDLSRSLTLQKTSDEPSPRQDKSDGHLLRGSETPLEPKVRLRRAIFQLHLVTGLAVGLYILLMSVTGTSLVFYDELSFLANPKLDATDYRQPLSRVVESVVSTYPNHEITWIHQTTHTESPLEVFVISESKQSVVLVNPFTAQIIGEKNPLLLWLRDLHFNLLSGKAGRTLNGIGAMFVLTMGFTGLAIWLTRQGSLKSRVTINVKSNWKRVNFDTHSAVGICALPMILIWGTSAIYFAFPEPFEKAVHGIFATTAQKGISNSSTSPVVPTNIIAAPLVVPPNTACRLNIDTLLERAKRQTPGLHTAWIKMPSAKDPLMYMSMVGSPFGGNDAVTRVSIDSRTGQIMHFSRPEDRALSDRFLSWISNLHFGNFGGLLSKSLWVVLGLTPSLLFVTGALMWWNRVLSKYLNKRKKRDPRN